MRYGAKVQISSAFKNATNLDPTVFYRALVAREAAKDGRRVVGDLELNWGGPDELGIWDLTITAETE